MSSAERDPRTDPRPGDVLYNERLGTTYEVVRLDDGPGHRMVVYREAREFSIAVDRWRAYRAADIVIARGVERSPFPSA